MELLDTLFWALWIAMAWHLLNSGGGGGRRARVPIMGR
jgi:hypothetical protein